MRSSRIQRTALRIALGYVALAAAWILLSDLVLHWLQEPGAAPRYKAPDILKGLAFVAASGVALYLLLRYNLRRLARVRGRQYRYALRLGAVMRNLPLTVSTQDLALRYTWSSRSRDGGGSSPDQEPLLEGDAERLLEAKRKVLRTRRPERLETRDLGERRFFDHHIEPEYAADGRLLGLVTITYEITGYRQLESELQLAEQRYRLLFEHAGDPIIVADAESGLLLDCNRRAEQLLGRSREELVERPQSALFPPDAAEGYRRLLQRAVARGFDVIPRARLQHVDGEQVLVEISAAVLDLGQRRVLLCSCRDIRDRLRAEEGGRLMAMVVEHSSEGILITDADYRIVAANPAFTRLSGYAAEEVVGQTPALLGADADNPALQRRLEYALATQGRWQGELWGRRKNGDRYLLGLTMTRVVNDNQVSHHVAIFTDLTERRQAEERMHSSTCTDLLTGLPNRAYLQERLAAALAAAERDGCCVAVLLLDLDRFKLINDSLGDEAGDRLLQEAAARLQACCGEDGLVGRVGGDSFAVVFPQVTGMAAAEQLAERVLSSSSRPYAVGDQACNVSWSVGLSLYPEHGVEAQNLLRHAESAMYSAKEAGRNRYRQYRPGRGPAAQERLQLENALHQALARDELLLHYQPQVDLRSRRVVGAEALLRWCHPQWGMVPPGKFIAIAEESGLIVRIGDWVMREACRQNRDWQRAGLAVVPIAVNLSATQFLEPDFAQRVATILQEVGLPAELLELEVTEGVILNDVEQTVATLQALRAMGLKLAIDDFGTGYSSLSYLRRFAIDKLKIDQSFIRTVEHDPSNAAIARAIIDLAHNLGLTAVAEGVETAAQTAFLERNGCRQVQGYLFGRPQPAAEFAALLPRRD